jgi:hypothetical protein
MSPRKAPGQPTVDKLPCDGLEILADAFPGGFAARAISAEAGATAEAKAEHAVA